MSADNWIYILHTKDTFKKEEYCIKNTFPNKIDAYRVAHAQAIDNFYWYKQNEPHNIWAYMYSIWWDSNVYYSLDEAYIIANELLENIWYTEYWISQIDAKEYSFYN